MKGLRTFLLLLLIAGVINVVLPLYGAGVQYYADTRLCWRGRRHYHGPERSARRI